MYFKVLATVAFITLLSQLDSRLTPISNQSRAFMDCVESTSQELNIINKRYSWWTDERSHASAVHLCNGGNLSNI